MTKEFVVLCAAQRLAYQDQGITPQNSVPYYAFGLNLTAAIGVAAGDLPVTVDEANALRPWAWARISKVLASKAPDGANPFECDVLPLPAAPPDVDLATLRDQLDRLEYNPGLEPDLHDVTSWPLPGGGPAPQNVPLDFDRNGRRKRWHSSILQLSTYPYPIPQQLNLSFIVKVPKAQFPNPADLNGPLFLAPIIPDTTFFNAATQPQVGALAAAGDGAGKVFRWKYDNGTKTGLEVAAYLVQSAVNEPLVKSATYIDLRSGWIKRDEAGFFEEDWRAHFEKRLGEVFDLAEHLIDYLREHAADLKNEPQVMTFYQQVVVSVMRDLAGAGLLPALNSNTLPDDLLGPDPRNRPADADMTRLRAIEAELFGEDAKWRRFLRGALPQVSGLKALSDGQTPGATTGPVVPRPVEEYLSDLEQLHKALLDPENLHHVVQQQWSAIFQRLEEQLGQPLPAWAQKLRVRINELKPTFDYRARLARGNLGPVWKVLRDKANEDISKNLDVDALVPALLVNHLQARLRLPQTEQPPVEGNDYQNYLPRCDANQQPSLNRCPGAAAPMALMSCIIAELKAKAPALISHLRPPAGQLDKATDVPHAVSLPAHLMTMLPNEQNSFEDVLNQISGVVVFLRDQGGPWFCLNHARANVRESTLDKQNLVTVPTRINYQNGLSQSLITYDNAPLVARSPLADISLVRGNATVSPGDRLLSSAREAAPLVRYDYSTDPRARIKALVFREEARKYEAALCVVTASGALPSEISDPDRPWEISQAKLAGLNFDAKPEYPRTFSYMRKVRVGEVRNRSELRPGQEDVGDKLKLPKVPEGVYPRALELPPAPPLSAGGEPRILADEVPLLLLAPVAGAQWGIKNEFTFELKKPATDVETWHRWVNDGNPNVNVKCDGHDMNNRVCVLRDYYKTLDDNRTLSRSLSAFDTSIDDPAVVGLHAELRRFDPKALPGKQWDTVVGTSLQLDRPPKPLPASLADVRSDPFPVVCKGVSGADGLVSVGTGFNVNCKPGEIYWLRVHAVVTEESRKRFAGVVVRELSPPSPTSKLRLTRPFELLIEVATDVLPTQVEVWQSLRPRFQHDSGSGHGDRVEVTLESNVESFRHAYRAELHRQTWYWQGRETKEFPALPNGEFINPDLLNPAAPGSAPGVSEQIMVWEDFEFAGREATDFSVVDFKRASDLGEAKSPAGGPAGPPPAVGPRRWFTYTEQLTPETANPRLAGVDPSEKLTLGAAAQRTSDGSREKGDLRANYYRFSAEVFSRYEGVINDLNKRSRRAVNTEPSGTDRERFRKWRRLFVPCRRVERPPIPEVKLILPLTESFVEHDATRSPGLLVILNEPWYEYGGLGEGLVAEVETLADPHNPPVPENNPCPSPAPGVTKFYFELGPDPIMASASPLLPQSNSANPQEVSTVSFRGIRGPVGHTRDEKDTGARFIATSFIIPAPKIERPSPKDKSKAEAVEDLSWYMCKIRLRRQMRLKGMASTAPSAVLLSEATEAQWVQYLPEFSLISEARDVCDLYISFPSDQKVAIKTVQGNKEVTAAELSGPVEKQSPVLTPVLLLTRTAYNVSGEKNQEVYVGFCWPDEGGKTWSLLPESGNVVNTAIKDLAGRADVGFRGRILGVQGVPVKRPGAPSPGKPPFDPMPRPTSSKEFCDSLFARNVNDEEGQNATPLSDVKRPRIVRISRQIPDAKAIHDAKQLADCKAGRRP